MMNYTLEISIDKITVGHLLGGLAKSYRDVPGSAPSEVAFNLKYLIVHILEQLHIQGIDVLDKRNQFYSYVKLVNYEAYLEFTKLD